MSDSFATPWTVARQAPLYMGFSRQKYWSGLPFPSPGDLPDPGIVPTLASRFFTAESLGKSYITHIFTIHEDVYDLFLYSINKLNLNKIGSI